MVKKKTKPPLKKSKPEPKADGKSERGRPSLLTKEVIGHITEALSIGSSYELSAACAGISYPTLQNWLKLARTAKKKAEDAGEQALSPSEVEFLNFLRQVEAANSKAGMEWQRTVHKEAKVDGAMALRMLSLRFSGYTAPTAVNFTANIDYSKLTDDQLQRLADGEDPAVVLADSSGGGSGTTPAAKS